MLATLPSTTVRRLSVPLVVVVHDLRHELLPGQFTPAQRALRRVSYSRGYAIADGHLAISRTTLATLHRLHPATVRTPSAVVHHGADHLPAATGPRIGGTGAGTGAAVTFAHHANKNLDLVLDAWRLLDDPPPLEVLGLPDTERSRVSAGVAARGLTDRVRLLPYLPAAEFRARLGAASLVVFAGEGEGFGLPVLEAMRLRIPVVLGPDPAVLEVAAGHGFAMSSWTPAELARAVRAGSAATGEELAAAASHASTYTWGRTVEGTRNLLASVSRGAAAPPAGP